MRSYGKIFLALCLAGFVGGILYANTGARDHILAAGIFSDYFLEQYTQAEIQTQDYFWYILSVRAGLLGVIALMGQMKKLRRWIVAAVLAVVAVLCVAGYFVYTTFFSTSPEEIIAADLEEHLSFYEDPETGEGDRLLSEADSVLSGLGAYCYPDDEAYTSWLDETSFEVGDITIAEDGETATATATITHMPLISYVEEYMGETDDAGEEQESELSVTYQRSGSEWSVDSIDLQQAVFDAYLPTDEELILSDVYWYFGDVDSINDEFILGLEAGAGSDLDQLGITAEEFAEAFLDGFNYEVGDVTVDGDVATVDVTITSKSMDEISTEFQNRFTEWASMVDPSTITSEDDLYKQGGQIFLEVTREAEAAERQVELTFTQDSSGVWWMDTASEDDLMGTMGV